MTNKKDNLKEKEIDREAPLKQNELGNISGGGCWLGSYIVYESKCYGKPCEAALCSSNCHRGAVKADLKPNPNEPNKNCWVAAINQELCTGCGRCDSQSACPNKAIQFELNWG